MAEASDGRGSGGASNQTGKRAGGRAAGRKAGECRIASRIETVVRSGLDLSAGVEFLTKEMSCAQGWFGPARPVLEFLVYGLAASLARKETRVVYRIQRLLAVFQWQGSGVSSRIGEQAMHSRIGHRSAALQRWRLPLQPRRMQRAEFGLVGETGATMFQRFLLLGG